MVKCVTSVNATIALGEAGAEMPPQECIFELQKDYLKIQTTSGAVNLLLALADAGEFVSRLREIFGEFHRANLGAAECKKSFSYGPLDFSIRERPHNYELSLNVRATIGDQRVLISISEPEFGRLVVAFTDFVNSYLESKP